jgi:signal transduction histidine kinase
MTDRGRVWLGRSIAVVGALLGTFGFLVLVTLAGSPVGLWTDGGVLMLTFAVFFALFVWFVIPRQPRNGVVWSMAASAIGAGCYLGFYGIAALLTPDPVTFLGDGYRPAGVSTAVALLATGAVASVYPGLFSWLTFGLLLFPDGRLRSRRWRWVAGLAVAGILASIASVAWEYRPSNSLPATEDTIPLALSAGTATLAAVLSLVSILLQFRDSRGAMRDQFKWVVWGAALVVPWFALAFFLGGTDYEYVFLGPVHVATAAMLIAYGIAVGKYRLFDVDVVISRTFVYGTLAVVITGLYIAVVAGASHLLGGTGGPNPALAIPATAAAAVAFHPMRRRLERWAVRIVYGKKATPYQVLSDFSQRVAAADPALLERVARSLVEGTGARRAAVSVWIGADLVEAAAWPPAPDDEAPTTSYPIEHDATELGRLTLTTPPGARLSASDTQLAEEVASGMGLALRNQQLTARLETRVEELRTSRRRLVEVQDETRRKLERDLHDGAQQQLVALKVKLGLARTIAEKDGGRETAALLTRLNEEADVAVQALRDFARGVYPPLLAAEGLDAAITSRARQVPIPVRIDADGIGRYDPQVEAAVYFCVVEALQNVTRYAEAQNVAVSLAQVDGALTFEVTDDGIGFDPAEVARGVGLTNMIDRIDAAGGTLLIDAVPGRGTTVRGSLPVEAEP